MLFVLSSVVSLSNHRPLSGKLQGLSLIEMIER